MPFSFEFVGSFFRLENFLNRVANFTTVGPNGNLVVRGRLLQIDGRRAVERFDLAGARLRLDAARDAAADLARDPDNDRLRALIRESGVIGSEEICRRLEVSPATVRREAQGRRHRP